MSNKPLKITSVQQLTEYANGQVVRFPMFGEGQPFVARIKRPSMMALAKSGKIPNALLKTANSLFNGDGLNEKNETALKDVFAVMDVICEACFVEPTYQEIKEAGIELTDEQLLFVFNYTQTGVKALQPFRQQSEYYKSDSDVGEVQSETVGANGN